MAVNEHLDAANNNLDRTRSHVLVTLDFLLLGRDGMLSMDYRGETGSQIPQDADELVVVRQWAFQASETLNWIRWLKSSRAAMRGAFPPFYLLE